MKTTHVRGKEKITKALIAWRNLLSIDERDGQDDYKMDCGFSKQGCMNYQFVNADDERVALEDGWSLMSDGNFFCHKCSECRSCCTKKINPQFLNAPAGTYSNCFGGISAGGLCHTCYKKIKLARTEWDKPYVYSNEDGLKPLASIKTHSTTIFKLGAYVRLQHEKDSFRQLEIGYFKSYTTEQDGSVIHYLTRLSQIGTQCAIRRGKNQQVWKKRRKISVPTDYSDSNLRDSRYMSLNPEDNIIRAIDYLRGIGYKVVEKKDARNGRKIKIHDDGNSKSTQLLEENRRKIDHNLGEKHREKLYKIEEKYRRSAYAPNWISEATR